MRSLLPLAPFVLGIASCAAGNHPSLIDESGGGSSAASGGAGGAVAHGGAGGATAHGGAGGAIAHGGAGGATAHGGAGGATAHGGAGGAIAHGGAGGVASQGGNGVGGTGGAPGTGGHAGGAPVDAGLDAPADAPADAPHDAPADAPPDAPSGPVDIGLYTWTPIQPPAGMLDPPAVAWHPSGAYALILNATDAVFRYDAAAKSLSKVGSVGGSVSWRTLGFTPDGTRAVLLGNSTVPFEGRVYLWDDATSQITQMASETFAGGTYQAIAWSPDGSTSRLLASKPNAGGTYLAYVWTFDPVAGRSNMKAKATSAGCEDLAFATDAWSKQAVPVTCGVNGVTLFHLDDTDQFVDYVGNAGNTSHIAARPQGDYALAIGWSGQRVYRFEQGNWTTGFDSPTLPGAYQVEFSTDGRRALVLGGCGSCGGANAVGQVYEFRHDHMQQVDFVDVSIPSFSSPPYNADSAVRLNDVAWRPACEGGLLVGGSNTWSSQKAYVVRFSVDNGVACPN
jgi:hypothetical protein